MLRHRCVTALTAAALCASLAAGCGNHGDGLLKGKVDIGLTTTTGATSCDAVVLAERALTEATFDAFGADAAARTITQQRLAELRASLPPELVGEVDALEAAFETAWATKGGETGDDVEDPFESDAYVTADQAIRQYADSCSGPRSTGDPSRVPTTSELPPEAMTIPLPPGEPPAGAT